MDGHDDSRSTWSTHRPGGGGSRPSVELPTDERRLFDEITKSMWLLRLTRGRRSTIFARAWVCLLIATVGATLGIATLGRLPVLVPFAGFVLAMIGIAELSRHAVGSRWWSTVLRLIGLEEPR